VSAWSGREWYFLSVLLLINTFNFLDRQVINILAEPIKNELKLADWQVGALTGLAFALLYTITGLPMARIAERVHRPALLGVSIGIWSAFTMLCGAAQSFWQLALCRTGVGLGEGGSAPISYSLIIDRVSKDKRATAIAVFACGSSIGGLLGMALGGLIADHHGWRVAFLVAGAPGIILALLAAFTLREPRGGAFATDLRNLTRARPDSLSLRDALGELMKLKSFPLIALGSATGGLVGFVHSAFFAAFMLRAHPAELERLADQLGGTLGIEMSPIGFLGVTLGLVSGVMGVLGTMAGGWLSDRMARTGGPGAYMTIPCIAKLAAVPFSVFALLSGEVILALAIISALHFVRSISHGPALSSVFALVRPELRPTTAAIMVFVIAIVGMGIGPIAVGLLSDVLAASGLGPRDGLRFALIAAEAAGIIGAILFFIARPIYIREAVS
jgi:predicted MFS family arabinose efflux permease